MLEVNKGGALLFLTIALCGSVHFHVLRLLSLVSCELRLLLERIYCYACQLLVLYGTSELLLEAFVIIRSCHDDSRGALPREGPGARLS